MADDVTTAESNRPAKDNPKVEEKKKTPPKVDVPDPKNGLYFPFLEAEAP